MAQVSDIVRWMDSATLFNQAESWDNVGLLVGDENAEVKKAWVCLDATPELVVHAAAEQVDLLVTHHPVIFDKLARLTPRHPVYHLVQAGIAVISAHTNLDMAADGVNDCLAGLLGLSGLSPLKVVQRRNYHKIVVFAPMDSVGGIISAMTAEGAGRVGHYENCGFTGQGVGMFTPLEGANPTIGTVRSPQLVNEVRLEMICPPGRIAGVVKAMRGAHPYEEPAFDIFETSALSEDVAAGRVGGLAEPMPPADFARMVKEKLGCDGLHFADGGWPVQKVAVCGGAGGSLLEAVYQAQAQAYVTSELRHHQLLEASSRGVTLVDAGHFYTERVVLKPLCGRLAEAFPQVDFLAAGYEKPPARYI